MLSLFIPLVTATITILFGCAVLLKDPKNKLNRLLSLLALIVVVSLSGIIGLQVNKNPGMIMLWSQAVLLAVIAFPPLGYSFSKEFIKSYVRNLKKNGYRIIWLYLACSLLFLLILPGRGIAKKLIVSQSLLTFEFTIFGELLLVYFLLAMIHISIILEPIFFSRAKLSGRRQRWLATSYFATAMLFIASVTQVLLGMALPIIMLWIGCGLISALFISYGFFLLKSKIDKIYLSSQAVYSSLLLISTGAYFVILGLSGHFLRSAGGNWRNNLLAISSLGAFFIFLLILFSSRSKSSIKSFWRQNVYQKNFDFREEWQRFSQKINGNLDLKKISDHLVQHIAGLFRFKHLALYLLQPNSKTFYRISKTSGSEYFPENINLSEEALLNSDNSHNSRVSDEVNLEMNSLDLSIIKPLKVEGELLGFLCCDGLNKMRQEKVELLSLFADQAALAIHNIQLTTELIEAKELESFNKVSSFIIHDLRNHIAKLSMLLQNAKKYLHLEDFQENMLQTLGITVNEMKALLSKISFGEIKEHQGTETVDLNDLIHEVVNNLNVNNSVGNIEINRDFSEVPPLQANKAQLTRIFENFCLNSIEAMPHGGTLTIETKCTTNKQIKDHSISNKNQNVEIRFSDTGIGMSEKFIRDKIFHPFSSTKKFGLGIGLFQCKEIVEALGGRIDVMSKVNQGTTFTISFPVLQIHANSFEDDVLIPS